MDYELEMNASDIGDIVTIIRVQHLKMHVRPFADKLGMKEKVILMTEEGKGALGMVVLNKIKDVFPTVSVTINVKINDNRKN